MDLLGDIVEKDPTGDNVADTVNCNEKGFPEPFKHKQISSWKQRLRAKKYKDKQESSKEYVSAAQSIHEENLETLRKMSPEAIERERKELIESLDPKLLQKLIRNIEKREGINQKSPFEEIEGAPGTWIGGNKENGELPCLNDEQVDEALGIQGNANREEEKDVPLEALDEDDVAPLDFQAAQSIDHMSNQELFRDVHFMKLQESQEKELKLDDPNFNDKLHEKFFPDLPKDVEKLKWMQTLPEASPTDTVIEDVSQCRFDFNGDLVPPSRKVKSTTHSALHHHSDDPQLAGYTIPELQRLSRSTFPAQRAMALQTLGRILYKLGKQYYCQLVPEVDLETYKEEGSVRAILNKIYSMFWDLCRECRIIDCLQDAADETKTRHLSVRSYALEALWLWKKGGGDFRKKESPSL